MTIYRDGKAFELTPAELNQAWLEGHIKNIREDVENYIADYDLPFAAFADFGYDSPDSFRSAFVEECTKEADELLDCGYSREGCITEALDILMKDYNLEVNF